MRPIDLDAARTPAPSSTAPGRHRPSSLSTNAIRSASRWITPAVAALMGLAACSAPTPTGAPSAPPSPIAPSVSQSPTAPSSPSTGTATGITKVLTIVLENHGVAAVTRTMPRVMALARRYGQTTHDLAETHPSLPNYLALAGGSTFGVRDDGGPAAHPITGPSVFDLALTHGHTARTYAEGMPTSCAVESSGRYAVKHNPWVYFSDAASRRACAVDDVPLGTTTSGRLVSDIAGGTLPSIGLVIPDLCHDAHDCDLATADAWVADWVARVQQGADWNAGRLAVVVTFDEAETGGDNTVMTVVVAPSIDGVVAGQALTHLSWTRWMSDLIGSPAPRDARAAPSLGAAFGW
ncbi:MAG TPA: alkaline phosphatase family protein [Cellulomonadaceae bacterium]|nr:alkaline phosphatase family protein [Cellulomonadaceae bacterium]